LTRSSRSARDDAADRYRSIFEHSIVPMWEEDISGLRELLAQWRRPKGRDLRSYLREHPALVRKGVRTLRVVDVNEAALRLYDAESKKQMLGPWKLVPDAEGMDSYIELFVAVAEGRQRVEIETSTRTLKGRKLEIMAREFIPAPGDPHPFVIVNVVDLTAYKSLERKLQQEQSMVRAVIDSVPDQISVKDAERKELERGLENERTLLREVIRHIPDMVFLKDTQGRFLIANEAVAETMNAPDAGSLIGKTDFDFYPRAMAEEFAADERRIMEGRVSIVNKEEPKMVAGRLRWILTTKVPLYDEQGKATGIVGVSRDLSSLKEAQDALARGEERYKTLVEYIGVGILSTDASGAITFANPAAAEIFGLPLGSSRGRNIREFLSDDALARVAEEIARRKKGDKSSYEIPIVRADGAKRWIHLTAVSRFDSTGAYEGSFSTLQDFTDRYMLETELSRQRAFMQTLMDNLPDFIYFKDQESRFILNNKAHAKELGAGDPAEVLGKTDFDFFSEEHARKAFNDEQRIMRTGEPLINDIEKETWADRPLSWVSSTKMPLKDEQGKIIGTFGVSRDMTERRRMEERNLRLAAIIESSNDAIIGIALDDTVTSWNKGAETIFGYTAEEMIGTSITPLLSPEIMTQEPELRKRMGREGHVLHTESTVTRKDGRSIYVSTSISVITDAEGQIVGITFISRDVTDQKALQVQLIRAQRLESLGTLASGIAHQFNNINTAVRGYLDFLSQDASLPASARTYIGEALKAVQRAVDITDRLLGLSVGASSISSEGLHLEEAVPAVVALFDKTLEMEGIRLEIDFPAMPAVRASHSALEFIVTSLMTNAVHALSGCASPSITIRGRSEAGFCSFEISDNGCGIPAEDLPRIFTPFFTTKGEWAKPGSRQAGVRGIGLSLAVCQSTVAERGGWIEVESPPGGGATFRVWLPSASQDTDS
jgi:two-component system sensor histidine kinase/response regulator